MDAKLGFKPTTYSLFRCDLLADDAVKHVVELDVDQFVYDNTAEKAIGLVGNLKIEVYRAANALRF